MLNPENGYLNSQVDDDIALRVHGPALHPPLNIDEAIQESDDTEDASDCEIEHSQVMPSMYSYSDIEHVEYHQEHIIKRERSEQIIFRI